MEQLSLCRGSVRGTWRGGFFSGDFESYVKKALEMKHLPLCKGPVRGTWREGFVSGDFERNVERALVMEHLSRCRHSRRGPGVELLFLGTLKDNGVGEETSALVFA
jgi:hypothetical protein